MNQYRKGTVSLVNGSTTVIGDSSLWLANILPGQMFFVQGDASEVVYTISEVVSDTELTLNAPYGGETTPSANYVINRDKTLNSGFHVIHQGDTGTALLVSENFKRLDTIVPNIEAATAEMDDLVEAAEAAAGSAAASAAAAQDAEENAEAAQGSAESAATTATSAATTATTQAGIATAGATSATTQAGIATTKATEASDSADSAASSAAAAETAEANAEAAEANAEAAEANAEAAAATATTQAGIATTQAGIATAAAGAAQTAEANAGTAEANAETAETNAEAAATSAAGSASAAATSASEAAASAAAAEASAASIDVSTFTQRAADETVTGAWSFDNTLYINGWTTIIGGASIVGPWAQFELVGDDHSYSVTHDNANGYLGIWDQTSSAWRLMVSDATGGISMPTNIAATSTSTGTLVLGGGLGVGGAVHASSFTGSGSGLSSLNASNLSTGTVPSGRLSGTYAIDVSGNAATASNAALWTPTTGVWHVDSGGQNRFHFATHTYLQTASGYIFRNSGGADVLILDSSGNASLTGGLWTAGELQSNGWLEATGWSGAYYSGLAGQFGVSGGKVYVHAYNGAAAASGPMVVYGSTIDLYADGGFITAYNGKRTIDVGDSYLRLNQAGHYANGVYTPYNLRVDGGTYSGSVSGGGGARYGSLNVSGSNNSWIGINFSSGQTDLMWNTDEQGAHKAGVGWQWNFSNGTLAVGTVPRARLSGVGNAIDYNVGSGGSPNTIPYQDASGYCELYYTRYVTGNSENPTIGQFITQNTSDNYMRKSSTGHVVNTIRGANGYYDYFWSNSHPNDYYLTNNWDGSRWYITSNHGSPVRVGYADSAGSASTATSATTASYATTAGTHAHFYYSTNTNPAGTNGAWTTYPLDTTGYNNIPSVTLSSHSITLVSGTYRFWATMMFHECNGQVRLFRHVGSTVAASGPRFDFTEDATCAGTVTMHGIITVPSTSAYSFQYYKSAGNLNQSDGGGHGESPMLNSVLLEKIG